MTNNYPPALVSQLPAGTRAEMLRCLDCGAAMALDFGDGVALCPCCGAAQRRCQGNCGVWTSAEYALCDRCENTRD